VAYCYRVDILNEGMIQILGGKEQDYTRFYNTRAGGVAQAVECLPSKYESMRPWVQTPVPTKNPRFF
jgi:hypothetical protein